MFSMYGAGGKSGLDQTSSVHQDTVTRKKLSVYAVALNPTTDPPAVVRPSVHRGHHERRAKRRLVVPPRGVARHS
jgi:hypothetical protein